LVLPANHAESSFKLAPRAKKKSKTALRPGVTGAGRENKKMSNGALTMKSAIGAGIYPLY
jgi:hypothetical protein